MRRLFPDEAGPVHIAFEGEQLAARPGDTVAAALLAGNHWQFRTTPVSGAPRGPFCMMGVCFECLVEIDGVANRFFTTAAGGSGGTRHRFDPF